jgi:hypothetical protein
MPWVEKRVGAGGKPRYVALYRDPTGAKRSAGTFASKVLATRAAYDAARTIKHSTWIDPKDGKVTFADYVEQAWWPSWHLEVSTAAAYRSNLEHHLLPYFGAFPLDAILPSTVQAWVSNALEGGLSPARYGSTTPCCPGSSPAPSATASCYPTPPSTPSCPKSSPDGYAS